MTAFVPVSFDAPFQQTALPHGVSMGSGTARGMVGQSSFAFTENYGAGHGDRACAAGFEEPTTGLRTSRLIRSVVAEAGLGRFVYLQGRSGKRFVFSSISAEQSSLYDRAIFASSRPGEDKVRIGASVEAVRRPGSMLYVHLLDDEDAAQEAALNDLSEDYAQ